MCEACPDMIDHNAIPGKVLLALTRDQLYALIGWANYVKFTPGDEWDDRDEQLFDYVCSFFPVKEKVQ